MLLGIITAVSALSAALICVGPGNGSVWALLAGFAGTFVLGLVVAFLFFFVMCKRVDTSVVQEHDSPFYRKMAEHYIRAIVKILRIKVHTQGMEQLPKEGRYLLVCNHLCIADPVVLLHCFYKSQLAFISKKENNDMFLIGQLMHKLLCQLINRENDREALKTILNCIQILKDDKASIAVFPEGYCSEDGLLHKLKPGVFKIAQKTNVPIVVCTLRGTSDVIPNMKKLKPSSVQMHLVGVVQPEEFAGKTTVDISERVFRMMADDLGPELVIPQEPEENC
ncbi:MAG: 1-acyl-sn-glycerol-3-phosphate acyltransferase [Oscillospiraceae bacterium]|nr:1-acyl-sn-glycerol-3-phosphate acyltransferase [Oscillospiraceae bacterium]